MNIDLKSRIFISGVGVAQTRAKQSVNIGVVDTNTTLKQAELRKTLSVFTLL